MKFGYVVIDTETGGLNPQEHALLSVGILFLYDDLERIRFSFEIPIYDNSEYDFTEEAIEINNLDPDMVNYTGMCNEDFFDFMEKIKELIGIDKFIPIGWNVSFDIGFLKRFLGEDNYNKIFHYKSIDLIPLYWYKYGEFPGSLKNTCKELGIWFDENKCHNALYDSYLTYKILEKLMDLE